MEIKWSKQMEQKYGSKEGKTKWKRVNAKNMATITH